MPYSDSMKELLKNGYEAKIRPSGHSISKKFSKNNGAAIPPNLIALANTESNSSYLMKCKAAKNQTTPCKVPYRFARIFYKIII